MPWRLIPVLATRLIAWLRRRRERQETLRALAHLDDRSWRELGLSPPARPGAGGSHPD